MTSGNLYGIAVAATFFWCGCVVAISFLEAWLKFQAPGVTLAIGLGIGRLVFAALNKVEWVLAFAVMVALIVESRAWLAPKGWLTGALLVLLVETFWFLPALDNRALAYMSDQPPGASSLHLVFVAAELVKVVCLIGGGITLLKLI